MNIAKLRKLKKWILDEPRRYNQGTWISRSSHLIDAQKPPCGTVACLAGSACLMDGYIVREGDWPDFPSFYKGHAGGVVNKVAKRILGLTGKQADDLFQGDASGWGRKNEQEFLCSTTLQGRAEAAAKELDRLIAIAQREKRRGSHAKKEAQ